jgi:inorganic triphosphatase YgiF
MTDNRTDTVERELKLVPVDASLLDTLEAVQRLGPFHARGRRRELQHNRFFDSASDALAGAHVGFRCRGVEGEPLAIWTIKGEAQHLAGVASRTEIELQLLADTPPDVALDRLVASARARGADSLAAAVEGALAKGPPESEPFLETETDRRIVDLEEPARGWEVELALDRVHLVGHAYREIEIEAELKRGDEEALSAVRVAIEALGPVRESIGSKLSRAAAHLTDCHCH